MASVLVFAASACSIDSPDVEPVALDAPDEMAFSDPEPIDVEPQPAGSADTPGVVIQADLARFVASAEAVMAGSAYENVIYDDPELYIAIAQTMCVWLDEGQSVDEVIEGYLLAGDDSPTVEDQAFAGALLGAGVQTLCPTHGSEI